MKVNLIYVINRELENKLGQVEYLKNEPVKDDRELFWIKEDIQNNISELESMISDIKEKLDLL